MPCNRYTAPPAVTPSSYCPAQPETYYPRGYMPPKGTTAAAPKSVSAAAKIATARALPVILQASSAGGDTVFAISNPLSYAYVIRSITVACSGNTLGVTPRFLASLRSSAGSAADATSYNSGVRILAPYADEEDIPVLGETTIADLWLPVPYPGQRLIGRFVNAAAIAGDIALIATITPASEIDDAFAGGADETTGTGGDQVPACRRWYRPWIVAPNGTLVQGDPICLDDLPTGNGAGF